MAGETDSALLKTLGLSVLMLAYEPGMSFQVLLCLHAMRAKVHVVGPKKAGHLRWSRYAASFHFMELTVGDDIAAAAGRIDRLAADLACDIVLASDIGSEGFLVRIAGALRSRVFPTPTEDAFRRLDDKWLFHNLATSAGVPSPKTLFIGTRDKISVETLERELGFPMVIKPSNEGNSNGVIVARSAEDLRRRVIDNDRYIFNSLLAQEYVPGADIDISILAVDGAVLASAVQTKVGREIFFQQHDALAEFGRMIARATSYSGVAHFDARLDSRDGNVKLIECNPRFWGSVTASLHCGLNFAAVGIKSAMTGSCDEVQVLRGGSFIAPTAFIAAAAKSPFSRRLWSRGNLKGLAATVLDPFTYLYEEWYARRRYLQEAARYRFRRPKE